jgi:hypothetical protein
VATYSRLAVEPNDDRSVRAQADRMATYIESLGWQPIAFYEPNPAQPPATP